MVKTKLIKKTLPVILSMGLSIINSEINTKQALTKNNAETQINRYSLENYEKNWLGDIRTVNVSVAADEEFIEKYGVLWKDKVNGFLVQPGDSTSLAATILKARSSRALKKMGVNGYNLVRTTYTWERATKQTNQVYQSLTL